MVLERPTTAHPRALLLVLCAAQFMMVLDTSIVNIALPSIGTALGFGSPSHLQYVISLYALTLGGSLIVAGRTADRLGHRRVFLAGLLLFTLSSIGCGLAWHPAALLIARGIQGVGAALSSAAGLAILTTSYAPGPERNRALAAWGAVGGGAGAAGLVFGGLITQLWGWAWVFLINVPIGLLIMLVGRSVISGQAPADRTTESADRINVPGALALMITIGMVIFGLTGASERGPADPLTWGPVIIAVGMAVLFRWSERRAAEPVLPGRLFRLPGLLRCYAVAFLLNAVIAATLFFTTLYLQQSIKLTPLQTGLAFLPNSCLVVAGSYAGSRIAARVGPRRPLLLGIAGTGIGTLLLAGIAVWPGALVLIMIGFAVIGLGLGLAFTSFTIAATQDVPAADQGVGAGVLNTTQQLGFALGIAAIAGIATIPDDPVTGYVVGYLVAAGLAGLAAVTARTGNGSSAGRHH